MYYKKNCLISLLTLLFSTSLLAQTEEVKKIIPDTQRVINILGEARQFTSKGSDSALYYARLAKTLSIKINWTKGVANSFMEVGEYYNSKGNYELSLKNFTEGFRIHDSINYKHGMSYATNCLGNMYLGWGNLDKALYNYKKSYEIAYQDSNKFMICVTSFGIANVYERRKQFSEALKCYSTAYYYIETLPRCRDFLPAYYINVSSILNELNRSDIALLNLYKALVVLKPNNDLSGIGNAYRIMAKSFSNLNKEDSVLYYYGKSERCFLEKGALDEIQDLYLEFSPNIRFTRIVYLIQINLCKYLKLRN
jgi:tetratricopeptide (TPR) repeat protein